MIYSQINALMYCNETGVNMPFSGMSEQGLENLKEALEILKKEKIIKYYDLKSGNVSITNIGEAIKRMENHVFKAFRIAFPDCIIRKTAVDLYLATVMNNQLKTGLKKEAGLLIMMLALENESKDKYIELSKFLKEHFDHFNFEKTQLQ